MHNNLKRKMAAIVRRAALAFILAAGCGLASASVIHVSIDTASFGAATGFLDMNFSTSGNAPLETATVSKLAGFQSAPYIESWGVTGSNGIWQFNNHTSNDLFQSVDFGGVLSFDLSFAGAADPLQSYVSEFVVSAFGADGLTPLGNYDPVTGALVAFAWTPGPNGGADGQIGGNVTDQHVALLPEPSQLLLMVIGLAALAATRRRSASE